MYQKQKEQLHQTLLPMAPDLLSKIKEAPDETILTEDVLFSELKSPSMKKRPVWRPILAACAILCLLCTFYYQSSNDIIATVSVQGCSTVEMSVNRSNKIIHIKHSNTEKNDYKDLEGCDLGEGMEKVLYGLQNENIISQNEHLILNYKTKKKNAQSKKAKEIVSNVADQFSSQNGTDITATYQKNPDEEATQVAETVPEDPMKQEEYLPEQEEVQSSEVPVEEEFPTEQEAVQSPEEEIIEKSPSESTEKITSEELPSIEKTEPSLPADSGIEEGLEEELLIEEYLLEENI